MVTVNWNTRPHLCRLLFGLRRVVDRGAIAEIVVVDNGSDDGSVALAREAADTGAIELIANDRQRYHGPGLTQGVNRLGALARSGRPIDLVWALDTDVLVLRPDVVDAAVDAMAASGSVLRPRTPTTTGPVPRA